jgi:hypothetical protein
MATITTHSAVVKSVDAATGAMTTVPGYEWAYTTTAERDALAPTVIPAAREVGGIIYDRTTVLDSATGISTATDTPLIPRDITSKAVTGPAWAWYLLMALLKRNQSDKTAAWLLAQIAAQTGLTLEYTP